MRDSLNRFGPATLFVLALFSCLATGASAADNCPRPVQGSEIAQPPDLYSQNGVLSVALDYKTMVDRWGRTLFCYVTPDGLQAPTLHVNPGDTLKVQLRNMEVAAPVRSGAETVSGSGNKCGSTAMQPESVNLHFHGLNVKPRCHGDEVIHTIVNPGETFKYSFKIPADEPPGLYWYHAHVHGIASPALQGGASGAIEVEGIANLQPAVAGLPQRYLLFRDLPLAHPPKHHLVQSRAPFWDVSMNFVPVPFPRYRPGVIRMQAGAQEFWRVANASADSIMDIQLLYDGKPQPLQIVAFDGVPTGSDDGKHKGTIITQKHILIPTAGRVEFIVTGPSTAVKNAVLITKAIASGPAGDVLTQRPLAQIQLTNDIKKIPKAILPIAGNVPGDRFAGVDDSMVTTRRKLYFSEFAGSTKKTPTGGATFFITVVGQTAQAYDPNEAPKITTHPGAVEDWTIENRTQEVHEFHIHQVHFQVIAINGDRVPEKKRQWYDTFQVGYWDGIAKKYPSITLRMDFRGAVEGEFVYHCHILDHEDAGMMANILVTPQSPPKGSGSPAPKNQASAGSSKVKKASIGAAPRA
jgi:FtsP/CotA-like multicopper oxidase with cupredoxin domain